MRARKAVIPAAGRGTRMQPISDFLPKELVPLGSRPALDFVLEEAAAGGIETAAIIVREGKETIQRFVEQTAASSSWSQLEIEYVIQPEPNGLGDAILCAADFLAEEPFALMLPDNIALSPHYKLSDLLDLHESHQAHILGILSLDHTYSDLYGDCGRFEGKTEVAEGEAALRIDRLLDKRAGRIQIGAGESVERSCGRSICDVDFIPELQGLRKTTSGELDETPAVQKLVQRGRVYGLPLPSPIFDVGNPRGYLAAGHWLYERR